MGDYSRQIRQAYGLRQVPEENQKTVRQEIMILK